MAKMNYERLRTENRSNLLEHQTRNYLAERKAKNRAAKRNRYGWWMKFNNEWYVAVDSNYKIGPERIVQVKKAAGPVVDYFLGDVAVKTIEYDNGSYSLFKVKKVA